MKKILTTLLVLVAFATYGQTFWIEDFGTGTCANQGQLVSSFTGANGTWTLTVLGSEGLDPNPWYVSTTEAGMGAGNCGNSCLNTTTLTNQTLHVGSPLVGNGDIGAAYDAGGLCGILTCPQTNRRAESPSRKGNWI